MISIAGDLDREVLVDEIKEYLAGKHTTLWGRQYSVFEDNGRAEAADWLADVLDELLDFQPEAAAR